MLWRIEEDRKNPKIKMGGDLEKFSKSWVFDTENGGRFVFELLWGVIFGKKAAKVGQNSTKVGQPPEKAG